eukprot:10382167-Alexandrium_andersonii.AAC.1
MGGPSRPVLAHQRTTAPDNCGWISTLHAATNRPHRHFLVSISWSECHNTLMPSNNDRTTRARPVGATGRGMAAGVTSAGRAGVAVLAVA